MVRRLPFVLAALALLSVTACEKPAPQVTVVTGGRVINVDASRYCHDQCRDYPDAELKEIKVRGDSQVSIDVPKRVAERGWTLLIGDRPQFARPLKESHYSLSIPIIPQEAGQDGQPSKQPEEAALPITIIEAGPGDAAPPTGEWKLQFLLRP